MNPCTVPTAVPDVDGDKRWQSIHRRFISDCREKDPDVIFLGDCIFETLQDTETWNQYFAPLHCLNFSIREDRTEHVLWRIENGALDNVNPKIVVLHVGTNNVSNSAAEVADGVLANVTKIRQKLPGAYILLPVSKIRNDRDGGNTRNVLMLAFYLFTCSRFYRGVSNQMRCARRTHRSMNWLRSRPRDWIVCKLLILASGWCKRTAPSVITTCSIINI